MFDRVAYKKAAKRQLKGNFTVSVILSLILVFVSICFGGTDLYESVTYVTSGAVNDTGTVIVREYRPGIIGLIGLAVGGILAVALSYFYLKLISQSAETKATFNTFFEGLTMWWKGILARLWQTLWVFLWTLLFIIPGIVKLFAYSQLFFIIAEHPDISVKKALKLSIAITQGHKGELFVMYISFIGWAFLATLTFGIGFLWLIPYVYATRANAYIYLKRNALERGTLTPKDFGLEPENGQGAGAHGQRENADARPGNGSGQQGAPAENGPVDTEEAGILYEENEPEDTAERPEDGN